MTDYQRKLNFDEDVEIVYVQGWKGKGDTQIYEGPEQYKIIEFRKNKETGHVNEDYHIINKLDVLFLWDKIIKPLELGEKYGYKYLVRKLIELRGINLKENVSVEIMMEAFNGGTNRSKYYFPLYYYPMKVLEAKGYIQYWGRGGISRLEDGELR